MNYVFPAVFLANPDGSYTVTFPDLPGCISEGKTLANALHMAESALTQWLVYLSETGEKIPAPSDVKSIAVSNNEFTTLVCSDGKNKRAVKRTVSIPAWMDEQASECGLSLSRVLQDALTSRLQ